MTDNTKVSVVVFRWNGAGSDPIYSRRTTAAKADAVAAQLGAEKGFWYGTRGDRQWCPQGQVERIRVIY